MRDKRDELMDRLLEENARMRSALERIRDCAARELAARGEDLPPVVAAEFEFALRGTMLPPVPSA